MARKVFKWIAISALRAFSALRPIPKVYAICTYHRIVEQLPKGTGPVYFMMHPVDVFQRQIEFLSSVATVIPLEEMADRIRAGIKPDKYYAAITFDDGYEDVIRLGLPILKKFNMPSTMFVSTQFIDKKNSHPFWDEVAWIALNASIPVALKLKDRSIDYDLNSIDGKDRFVLDCVNAIKYGTIDEKAAVYSLLKEIKQSLRQMLPPNSFATWEELRNAVKDRNVSIGGHTVSHPRLSHEGEAEIKIGKERLEEMLGIGVSSFAYPFGEAVDFTENTKHAVRNADFKCAVTMISGWNDHQADIYALKRIACTNENSIGRFRVDLLGADAKEFIRSSFSMKYAALYSPILFLSKLFKREVGN